MSKYGSQVDEYGRRSAGRLESEFGARTPVADAASSHGTASAPVRGPDRHSADWIGEHDPHPPAQPGRSAQADLRGAARDARWPSRDLEQRHRRGQR
jgi:hypothetical protein